MSKQFVIDDLKREVVLSPDDARLRFELGSAFFGDTQYPNAIKQLEKALTIDDNYRDARLLLVRALEMADRHREAYEQLEKAVKRSPDDLEFRERLLDIFMSIGRLDDAILHARHLAQVDGTKHTRFVTLSELYKNKGLTLQAAQALEQAHRMRPEDQALAADLRQLYLDLGDDAGAERVAGLRDRAYFVRQAKGTIGQLKLAGSLVDVGRLLVAGDVGGAKRALSVVDLSEQSGAEFELLRAEIALIDGNLDRAEKSLRACLDRAPTLALAWNRLGDVTQSRGKLREALAHYERAVNLDPNDANALEDLGDLYSTLGEREKAESHYRRAAALDPNARAQDKLKSLAGLDARNNKPRVGWIYILSAALRDGEPFIGIADELEAAALPGRGDFVMSGNAGQSMEDSGRVAFSCLRARAAELGVADFVRDRDLHIHVVGNPEIKRDGGSAGLAFVLASISAYTGRPVREKLAASGVITISGEVQPVGGIHEKVIAAHLIGIRTVVLPKRNMRAARDLPDEVADAMEIIYVDTVAEAIDKALLKNSDFK